MNDPHPWFFLNTAKTVNTWHVHEHFINSTASNCTRRLHMHQHVFRNTHVSQLNWPHMQHLKKKVQGLANKAALMKGNLCNSANSSLSPKISTLLHLILCSLNLIDKVSTRTILFHYGGNKKCGSLRWLLFLPIEQTVTLIHYSVLLFDCVVKSQYLVIPIEINCSTKDQ